MPVLALLTLGYAPPAKAVPTAVSLPSKSVSGNTRATVRVSDKSRSAIWTTFYVDGRKIGAADRKPPFSLLITAGSLTPGRHILSARTKFAVRRADSSKPRRSRARARYATSRFNFEVATSRAANGTKSGAAQGTTGPDPVESGPPPNDSGPPPGDWALDFADEFSGTSLDPKKWCSSWFRGSKMNGVATSADNVKVADGNLALTLSAPGTGALVNTNPTDCETPGYQFGTGYYAEARIRFPGNGAQIYNWPTWWTDGQRWPLDGEIDIAEVLEGKLSTNYHSSSYDHHSGPIAGTWANEFHTFAVDRQPGVNSIYFDGKLVANYPSFDAAALHYLILNVGGDEVFGAASRVNVDWVRVWKRQ
ncbi:MAG: glycoside hydrolase family 16 protein [Solirubrobacterales bacterium]